MNIMEEWMDKNLESTRKQFKLFNNKIDTAKGIIYSVKGKKIIANKENKCGYYNCSIFDTYGNHYNMVHQVIMAEFLQLPKHKWPVDGDGKIYEVDHLNKNRTDNKIENLQLVSKSENNYRRRKEKNKIKHMKNKVEGEKPKSKIVYQYNLDNELVGMWSSACECGRNGFNQAKISECCNGKRKTHKGYRWSFEPL